MDSTELFYMVLEKLPPTGLGLDTGADETTNAENVEFAIEAGYRHVDTAQWYGTESAVGKGLDRSDIPRDDVWVATKVHPENLAPEDVVRTTKESMNKLNVDVIDLHYVHWPTVAYDPKETIDAFDQLQSEGLVRHIGVCNFTVELLDDVRETLDSRLFAHQIEMHPLLQQTELVNYAQENDIQIVAYCPLTRGEIFDISEITEIAKKHNATEAQVTLAWLTSKDNVVAIPGSASQKHIEENILSQELDLDSDDLDRIDSIDRQKRIVDPNNAPWN